MLEYSFRSLLRLVCSTRNVRKFEPEWCNPLCLHTLDSKSKSALLALSASSNSFQFSPLIIIRIRSNVSSSVPPASVPTTAYIPRPVLQTVVFCAIVLKLNEGVSPYQCFPFINENSSKTPKSLALGVFSMVIGLNLAPIGVNN